MRISVIIPVYNGAAVLERALVSLERSSFRDYECIVVDDASSDGSRAVAAHHGATVLALEHNGGPAHARNRAAEQAGGDLLVFLDADVCAHPDTLGAFDAHFRTHPTADAVIGSYDDTPADPGFVSQYKNLLHHYVHHASNAEAWTFWAGCGAIRRAVFAAVSGFDESYKRPSVEDIELGFRLRAHGHRIDLNAAIQVTHLKRWTLWSLVRTDFRDRAIPWFLLMLRDRTMPADLNVTRAHRLSVALVFALVVLCVAAVARPLMTSSPQSGPSPALLSLAATGLAATLLVLNSGLYRFFARVRGFWFAARAVPLHWLYYGYCGLAVACGLTIHLCSRLTSRRPRARFPAPGATR